jgi:hypothetical protein
VDERAMDRDLLERDETRVDHWLYDLLEHRESLRGDQHGLHDLGVNQMMDDLKMISLVFLNFSLRSYLLLQCKTLNLKTNISCKYKKTSHINKKGALENKRPFL